MLLIKGLITRDRQRLEPHKIEFARHDVDSKTVNCNSLQFFSRHFEILRIDFVVSFQISTNTS
jgi:hypothetical protein